LVEELEYVNAIVAGIAVLLIIAYVIKRLSRERERVPKLALYSILYIALIVLAEVTTSFADPSYGLFFHSIIFLSLLIPSALSSEKSSHFFQALSLAPLIRIISLSLPLAHFQPYAWYMVASVPVFLATLALMRVQGLGFREVGLRLSKPLQQGAVALTGIPFGAVEYFILRPQPLAGGLPLEILALLAIGLVISTGLVEELVFRGVMQQNAVYALGEKGGLACVAALFSALHIGWLSLLDILFVLDVGLFFGYVALKTGSILGVSLSHGITNVFLFLVMPSIVTWKTL